MQEKVEGDDVEGSKGDDGHVHHHHNYYDGTNDYRRSVAAKALFTWDW